LGEITGARVLSEFGDDPHRYASGKARRNYAGTSPITALSARRRSSPPGSSATTGLLTR
jgi:Transposase IS116/IS110/IS902 family